VLTKEVWERTQKSSHFKAASNSVRPKCEKVWERHSHAFPPDYTRGYKPRWVKITLEIAALRLSLFIECNSAGATSDQQRNSGSSGNLAYTD